MFVRIVPHPFARDWLLTHGTHGAKQEKQTCEQGNENDAGNGNHEHPPIWQEERWLPTVFPV
jgi:hypothetical protein